MTTRAVKVKNLILGGGFPVSIQTMWKEPLPRIDGEILARIEGLAGMGCDILRFACPDLDSADVLGELASKTAMPIVADIHFDWRIALRCLEYPIAKIRINPGNIGERARVEELARKAGDKGVPIRIGVNGGSLPRDLQGRSDRAAALVEAAERELAVFDGVGFADAIVSMKASDVATTLAANRLFASRNDAPLHLGVTEAGPLISGIVKNTAALVPLLSEGIGATLRVSLSDSMENEVKAGREILSAAGLGRPGVMLVSCPMCGRSGFDTQAFARRWEARLLGIKKNIVVAAMGCVVNGIGEGRHADLGISGAGDKVIIFKKGKIVRTVEPQNADTAFEEELESL